jgi:acyl-CoA reductase-like NAD-dependent aldehyde dehydrogenase
MLIYFNFSIFQVHGSGKGVGQKLCESDLVQVVSFTGSVVSGIKVAQAAGKTKKKNNNNFY